MHDVLAWLRAQIEERLTKAKAATPGPWSYDPGKVWLEDDSFVKYDLKAGREFVGYGGPSPLRGCVAATGPSSHPQSMRDAEFIAANDPQDVIARCEFELAEIARHLEGPCRDCVVCERDAEYPCEYLRRHAYSYRHREGFKEEWTL